MWMNEQLHDIADHHQCQHGPGITNQELLTDNSFTTEPEQG